MKFIISTLVFSILITYAFCETENPLIKMKIISLKDCKNDQDSLRVVRVNHSDTIAIPGDVQFGGKVNVKKALPDNWSIETIMKIQMPFLGWVTIPCQNNNCVIRNVCKPKYLDQCKSIALESGLDGEKICKCDYQPGVYELPVVTIPLTGAGPTNENEKNMASYFIETAKGRDVRFQLILRSAYDNARFGCFQGKVRLV